MSVRVKHEWAIVPAERCDVFDAAVDELGQAQVRAQEVSFGELPAFYRGLAPWRCLAHHRLPGVRMSWSDDAAAANLASALGQASGFNWDFLDGMAQLVSAEEVRAAAGALARVVARPDGPLEVVLEGLAAFRGHDRDVAREAKVAAAELASPDGASHGAVSDFVELLRNLCATFHEAARRGDGVLYLSYSVELTPSAG